MQVLECTALSCWRCSFDFRWCWQGGLLVYTPPCKTNLYFFENFRKFSAEFWWKIRRKIHIHLLDLSIERANLDFLCEFEPCAKKRKSANFQLRTSLGRNFVQISVIFGQNTAKNDILYPMKSWNCISLSFILRFFEKKIGIYPFIPGKSKSHILYPWFLTSLSGISLVTVWSRHKLLGWLTTLCLFYFRKYWL